MLHHPVLGDLAVSGWVEIEHAGRKIKAVTGEPIAAALMAAGISVFSRSRRFGNPRGLFCAIGRCTDCLVDIGEGPKVRACVTPVRQGLKVIAPVLFIGEETED
ncbi:MAG: (2Fe-2S)-binding protein [Firmicutes bacterium]|nr:(2Fe-2S)-binding protein [Bacillota bacterium]